MRRYLTDIDLADNQILNVTLQDVTDSDTPILGRVAYHTVLNSMVVGNGMYWVPSVGNVNPDYAIQIDDSVSGVVYIGYAPTGSDPTLPVWKIKKVVVNNLTNSISVTWAGGINTFVNAWSNHLTLSYS